MKSLVVLVVAIVTRLEAPSPWVRDVMWLGLLAISILVASATVVVPIVMARALL